MARRKQTDQQLSPAERAIVKRASQGKGQLMALPTAIKPEWQEAAKAIVAQRKTECPDAGRWGTLANEDAVASILSAIDAGLTPQQAGSAIGLSTETVQGHIRKGEQDIAQGLQTARVMFVTAAKMANDRRRMRLLGGIEASSLAGPQYWTAGAWLLERGYGADYKLQADTGKGQVIVNVGVIGAADVRIGGADAPILPSDVSIPGSDTQPHNVVDTTAIPVTG